MLTKEPQQTWVFDRYVNGVLMAEGVEVTRASSLEEAMVIAARLAARGPNGETPVLILCNALDALARAEKAEQERDRIDQWRETAIVERDTYSQERDEAQAAQAGVVERCAAEMDLAAHIMSHHGSFQEQRAYENAAKSIRSLADPTGVKLLAELRAERDSAIRGRNEWRDDYKALAKAIVGETGLSAMTVAAQARLYRPRAEAAEAQLAEAQKREAGLRAMIRVNMLRYGPADLTHEDIDRQIEAAIAAIRAEAEKITSSDAGGGAQPDMRALGMEG